MRKNVENSNITGSNPVGTIISFYGLTAPEGYLVCDGSIYNRADYPELSSHLVRQFADLVGDGSTTFKVPDLRGEFLRGTGTNLHTNQGSGATVGVHQDATSHIHLGSIGNGGNISTRNVYLDPYNVDAYNGGAGQDHFVNAYAGGGTKYSYYTSRPTNTSVLYCIKY